MGVFWSENQTKTPTRGFFYISVENVSICTKFSRYVCEELGIPTKSKFNIRCIQIFIVYRGSVKRIIIYLYFANQAAQYTRLHLKNHMH